MIANSPSDTTSSLIDVIHSQFQLTDTQKQRFRADLKINQIVGDSLDLLELAMAIEDVFDLDAKSIDSALKQQLDQPGLQILVSEIDRLTIDELVDSE